MIRTFLLPPQTALGLAVCAAAMLLAVAACQPPTPAASPPNASDSDASTTSSPAQAPGFEESLWGHRWTSGYHFLTHKSGIEIDGRKLGEGKTMKTSLSFYPTYAGSIRSRSEHKTTIDMKHNDGTPQRFVITLYVELTTQIMWRLHGDKLYVTFGSSRANYGSFALGGKSPRTVLEEDLKLPPAEVERLFRDLLSKLESAVDGEPTNYALSNHNEVFTIANKVDESYELKRLKDGVGFLITPAAPSRIGQ